MNENSTMNNGAWDEQEFDLDKAWVQMRDLLNKELPVEQARRKRIAWLWWGRMAAMLITGVGIAVVTVQFYSPDNKEITTENKLHLNENGPVKQFPAKMSKKDVKGIAGANDKDPQTGISFDKEITGRGTLFFNRKINSNVNDRNLRSSFTPIANQITVAKKMDTQGSSAIDDLRGISNNILPRDSARTLAAPAKSNRRPGVELGVYYNTGTNFSAIYPVAKYHFPAGKENFFIGRDGFQFRRCSKRSYRKGVYRIERYGQPGLLQCSQYIGE